MTERGTVDDADRGVAFTDHLKALVASREARGAALAGVAAFVLYQLTREPGFQVYNVDVLVADAFLQGRFDIPDAPAYLETVPVDGRHYSPKGPLIAVLLVPFVAVWGTGFDQTHLGALLGAAIAATAWSLAGRLDLTGCRRLSAWALPVLGTTVWYESKTGALWGVSSLGTALFLLLALNEYFGKRRMWAVGLFCGFAMLCRAPAVFALGGFALAAGRRRWISLGLGFAGPFVVYAAYNMARFGTPFDMSLHILFSIDDMRHTAAHGPFSPAYLPQNLFHWIFLAPRFDPNFPWIRLNYLGQSIFLTSPALIFALGARKERWLWVSLAGAIATASMFFYIGASQFGIRFLIDGIPFAYALVCVALREDRAPGYLVLLAASIAMNAYGVFYTNVYGLVP